MKSLFEHPQGDRPVVALALLLLGVFALALQDSLIKLMSADTSFWQFQTLRSIGNLSFIIILAMASGSLALIFPRNWRPVYLRAAFLTVCMFFFFAGAPYLTVPQMAAGLYTYPLFVSLLAGPVLGETVGPWRTNVSSASIGLPFPLPSSPNHILGWLKERPLPFGGAGSGGSLASLFSSDFDEKFMSSFPAGQVISCRGYSPSTPVSANRLRQ